MNKVKKILNNINNYSNNELLELFIEFRGIISVYLFNNKIDNKEKDLIEVIKFLNEILILKLKECKEQK